MLSSQTSFYALFPELPPKTIKKGLLNNIVCPYRCPGVAVLFETSIIFHTGLNYSISTLFGDQECRASL